MLRCSFSEKDCSRTKSKIVTEVLFFVFPFNFISSDFVSGGVFWGVCCRWQRFERLYSGPFVEFRGAGAGALRRDGIGVCDFRERMGRGRSNG